MLGRLDEQFDVAVIGAGLQGSSTAFYLSQVGLKVILLDRDFGGRHSSNVNAGGIRVLWRDTAEIPLALAAKTIWPTLPQLIGSDGGFRATGQLKVAESEAEMRILEERVATLHVLGYDHEKLLDGEALKKLVPSIAKHCVGALWVSDDGYGSPFGTNFAFQMAAKNNSVKILRHSPVVGIEKLGRRWQVVLDRACYVVDHVVNCAGAWGDAISAMVDESVPLSVEAPMMMVSAPMPRIVNPVLGCVGRKLSIKQVENGTLLIGGGYRGFADRETALTRLRFDRLSESAKTVIDLFPALKSMQIVRCWAGIEGLTPDKLPIISKSKHEGFYHAFGFSSHGYQLGPLTGSIMTELIVHGHSKFDLRAFSVDRFGSSQPA